MPKTALQKARKTLSRNDFSSDSDSSISSIESGEHSHIPIRQELPKLNELSILELTNMEQLSGQLASIMQQLQLLNENQQHQQLAIERLQNDTTAVTSPPITQQGININTLYSIPDPVKAIPPFDGSRRYLLSWVNMAESTLNLFKDHVSETVYKVYVTAVANKLQARARDIICLAGNPTDFETIKQLLINALGDRQELSTYKCQLWQNHMVDGMSIQKYYQKTKEIIQNIKTLAKQKEDYRNNWQVINNFIDEDGLAAFIAGLSKPYFGYAQAARPTDLEDAYAFLCKFKSKETAATYMAEQSRFTTKKPPYQKSYQKTSYQNNSNLDNKKPEHKQPENQKYYTTPMEVDPSMRSRLTLNKKSINNQELNNEDSDDDDNEVTLNFQQELRTETPT